MKKFPVSCSTAIFSIVPLILLFSNSAFSADELVNEVDENQVPVFVDPFYWYYLEGLQDSSDEDLHPNDEYDLEPRSSDDDVEDMQLEKRGGMWKFRSGKRGGDLWKFRGGKRDNLWKFRGGKRAALWKFRGGKRADLWKFRGGKRDDYGKRESLWKLRGGKRGGSAAWKLRSG